MFCSYRILIQIHLKKALLELGNGSVGRVLSVQAGGPEFKSPYPLKKLGVSVNTCNLRAKSRGTQKQAGVGGFLDIQCSQDYEL